MSPIATSRHPKTLYIAAVLISHRKVIALVLASDPTTIQPVKSPCFPCPLIIASAPVEPVITAAHILAVAVSVGSKSFATVTRPLVESVTAPAYIMVKPNCVELV